MNGWIRTVTITAIAWLAVGQGIAQTATSAVPGGGNDYSFNVSTTQPWTDTGVELQSGDVLKITASGSES